MKHENRAQASIIAIGVIVIVIAAAVAYYFLTKPPEEPKELIPLTLSSWFESDPEGMEEQENVVKWGEEHGYDITIIIEDSDVTWERLTVAGGDIPSDVYYLWTGDFAAMAVQEGYVMPLDEYITSGELAQLESGLIDAMRVEGVLYALPALGDVQMLWYRPSLIETPPTTPEEFLAAVEAANNPPDHYGYVSSWSGSVPTVCKYLIWLYTFGGEVFDETGAPAFNGPEGVAALEFMKSLVPYTSPGSFEYDDWDAEMEAFARGEAAMQINWMFTDTVEDPETATIGDDWAQACWHTSVSGPDGYYVNAYTENSEAAVELVKYLTMDLNRAKVNLMMHGVYSPVKAVHQDPDVQDYWGARLEVVMDQFAHCGSKPAIPEWAEIGDMLASHVILALQGADAQAELDAAAAEAEEILGL